MVETAMLRHIPAVPACGLCQFWHHSERRKPLRAPLLIDQVGNGLLFGRINSTGWWKLPAHPGQVNVDRRRGI